MIRVLLFSPSVDDGAFSHLYHFAGNEYHLKFE